MNSNLIPSLFLKNFKNTEMLDYTWLLVHLTTPSNDHQEYQPHRKYCKTAKYSNKKIEKDKDKDKWHHPLSDKGNKDSECAEEDARDDKINDRERVINSMALKIIIHIFDDRSKTDIISQWVCEQSCVQCPASWPTAKKYSRKTVCAGDSNAPLIRHVNLESKL